MLSGTSFGQNNAIVNDLEFAAYLKNANATYKSVTDIIIVKNLAIIDPSKWTEQNFATAATALGFTKTQDFKDFLYQQDVKLRNLETKYQISKFTSSELSEVLTENNILIPAGQNTALASCNTKYNVCVGIAFGVALGANAGCLVIDTATAGLAAYLCHAGAFIVYAGMLANCQVDYDECKEGK